MYLIGKPAPAFELEAVQDGQFKLIASDDFAGRWLVLLFYPLDFTFVCPTELWAFSDRLEEFRELGAEVLGISGDSQFTHLAWTRTPRHHGGIAGNRLPLLADIKRDMSRAYGVLNEQGIALRGLFIIDPDGVIQHATINNLSVGRNVDEALRTIQACQFVRHSGEVCPVNWRPGDETIEPQAEAAAEYFASRGELATV
jgi:peroxiredoxin (alkyl hydroperoxide reductase subunit C)